MISIITPIYNAEKYLKDTIKSVIDQSYENWELLLINDGSTDMSKQIALSIRDARIRYFEQENKGVSAARNVGLSKMKGDYFCFLDADDTLPINSLEDRILMFESDSSIKYVDGFVNRMDSEMKILKGEIWKPDFEGLPLSDLVQLTGKSFFGPTWMIKRDLNRTYQLDKKLTHGEDLYFYMSLAKEGGNYSFTPSPILNYRDTPNSAMKNLKGLEKGYRYIENKIKHWAELSTEDSLIFKYKWRRSMFLSYLKLKQFSNAIKVFK